MVKEVHFFTEMGYTAYSQDLAAQYGYTNLMFPNENFSPERARELYGMYFEELEYCTEAGYDGIMINEHHNNPLNMMPSINVIGAVLAKSTKRVSSFSWATSSPYTTILCAWPKRSR